MKIRTVFCFFITLFVLSSCSNSSSKTTVRKNSNFNATALNGSLLVLPTKAHAYERGLLGNMSRLYNYEEYIETVVVNCIVKTLQNMGYNARLLPNSEIYSKEMRDNMLITADKYKEEIKSLYKMYTLDKQDAFNIKNNIGTLSFLKLNNQKKKLVLFSDYIYITNTNNTKVKDLALGLIFGTHRFESAEGLNITVGIVDYYTGNIMWTNKSSLHIDVFESLFNDSKSERNSDEKMILPLIREVLGSIKDTGKE